MSEESLAEQCNYLKAELYKMTDQRNQESKRAAKAEKEADDLKIALAAMADKIRDLE